MIINAYTRKADRKAENEDKIVIGKNIICNGTYTTDTAQDFFALLDGVGGNKAGNEASWYLANLLIENNHSYNDLELMNNMLIERSLENPEYDKMATTLTLADITSDEIKITYSGNTRAYRLAAGKYLRQLTKDDTLVEYLLHSGQITEEEAFDFDRKNQITSCFGGGNNKFLSLKTISVENKMGTTLILTTDGIHDHITIDEFEEIIQTTDDRMSICLNLAEKAIEHGSLDDISILIADL